MTGVNKLDGILHQGSKSNVYQNRTKRGCSVYWMSFVEFIRSPFLALLKSLAITAATYPKGTIVFISLLSCGVFSFGAATNFRIEVSEDALFTPRGSFSSRHMAWIEEDSGFAIAPRQLSLLFHQDGQSDMINRQQMGYIFQALDILRSIPNYNSLCADNQECSVSGITQYWNNNSTAYALQNETDIRETVSSPYFPDGTTSAGSLLVGKPEYDNITGLLVGAQSITVVISLPQDDENGETSEFEEVALEQMLKLKDDWLEEGPHRIEVVADRSFSDEFERAILIDLPLVPLVFFIMGAFTSLVFWKKDRVLSRSFLGLLAVVSVLLSIMAGYGIMFACGVPFTSATQIIPFVFFGIGLDDAFIITGSYFRGSVGANPVQRVADTVDDIGASIFLTTLTSSVAFGLGATSSIPCISWLCLYGMLTIVVILLWQLTFFVACIVLDDRRIQAQGGDCFRCLDNQQEAQAEATPFTKCFMEVYSRVLLNPGVKLLVSIGFLSLFFFCCFRTTKLKQAFSFTDLLPSDSYITPFFDALNGYSTTSGVTAYVFFRYVDVGDASIREQMNNYLIDLSSVEAIGTEPERCWFRDLGVFIQERNISGDLFTDQLDAFMADPIYKTMYRDDIVLDASGNVTASRCLLFVDNIDLDTVQSLTTALHDQRDVSLRQPINNGTDELKFFLYDNTFNNWEFYSMSRREIFFTTFVGIATVTLVAACFIPNPTAALFGLAFMVVLYVDLLGLMQVAGIDINPISYITLVMSIGLLVDFILHLLIRFYETRGTRHERVAAMIGTMGSSILIGGITTFLGTVPLVFSTSSVFWTVFIAFLAIVSLGVLHGLVLLPVVLSICGPEQGSSSSDEDENEETELPSTTLAESGQQGGTKMEGLSYDISDSGIEDEEVEVAA